MLVSLQNSVQFFLDFAIDFSEIGIVKKYITAHNKIGPKKAKKEIV